MPIIGFNLDKINVEKTSAIKGKIQIKNDLGITDIETEKITFGSEQDVLKLNFKYKIDYEPKLGNISIKGHILYLAEKKEKDNILKEWKKDQKLPNEIMPLIFNTILAKCNIKALTLSQEVNLPPHISLPKLQPKK